MYIFTKEIRERLRPFLEEYLDFSEKTFGPNCDGVLKIQAIKESIEVLCNSGIFTTEELSRQVIIECHVILPVCVINEILEAIK